MRHRLSPSLCLFLLFPSSLAISLSQFQTIANFPDPCTKAYNSQVSGCTTSDFTNGSPCSTSCISGLQEVTTLIDSACAGSEADPTTLIGMFFVGKGVHALCPNYATSKAEASSGYAESSTPSAVIIETSTLVASSLSIATSSYSTPTPTDTPTPTSTDTPTPTSTTASSTLSTTTVSNSTNPIMHYKRFYIYHLPQSSTVSVLPVPLSQSTTSTPSASPLTTAAPSTSTSEDRPTFVKTAINDGSATVITSKADQTASTNPDAFGGGGSPFEVSAGVRTAKGASGVALLAVLAGLVWVV